MNTESLARVTTSTATFINMKDQEVNRTAAPGGGRGTARPTGARVTASPTAALQLDAKLKLAC